MLATKNVNLPMDRIKAFCRKWKVTELSLFGSVLRDDFRPDSDIDVLISFYNDAPWSLYDWVDMIDELNSIFARQVDLTAQEGLRNPFRRREILRTKEVLYAA